MEKPYQIESQRAVKRLQEMAADGNPAVQMSRSGLKQRDGVQIPSTQKRIGHSGPRLPALNRRRIVGSEVITEVFGYSASCFYHFSMERPEHPR
jgi:hypothetical protein